MRVEFGKTNMIGLLSASFVRSACGNAENRERSRNPVFCRKGNRYFSVRTGFAEQAVRKIRKPPEFGKLRFCGETAAFSVYGYSVSGGRFRGREVYFQTG